MINIEAAMIRLLGRKVNIDGMKYLLTISCGKNTSVRSKLYLVFIAMQLCSAIYGMFVNPELIIIDKGVRNIGEPIRIKLIDNKMPNCG